MSDQFQQSLDRFYRKLQANQRLAIRAFAHALAFAGATTKTDGATTLQAAADAVAVLGVDTFRAAFAIKHQRDPSPDEIRAEFERTLADFQARAPD